MHNTRGPRFRGLSHQARLNADKLVWKTYEGHCIPLAKRPKPFPLSEEQVAQLVADFNKGKRS